MRTRMLAFLIPLAACLSLPAHAQVSVSGGTPSADVPVDAEAPRLSTREADPSDLTSRRQAAHHQPDGAPRLPDPPPADATSPSMIEVTLTKQSGGYERVTSYERVKGEWVLKSDTLTSCEPASRCQRSGRTL